MKLGELLKKHDFKFSKKYGQNFLSDGNLLESIAVKGGVDKTIPVLEIGCGAGTLTKVLCEKSKYVFGYEIDNPSNEFFKTKISSSLVNISSKYIVFGIAM